MNYLQWWDSIGCCGRKNYIFGGKFEKVFSTISDQTSFWKHSIFKKRDTEEAGMKDANDTDPALLPPGLPSPEDENEPPNEDYEDPEDRNYDDLPDEGKVLNDDDPSLDMGSSGEDEPA
jgi:hypothetical protein